MLGGQPCRRCEPTARLRPAEDRRPGGLTTPPTASDADRPAIQDAQRAISGVIERAAASSPLHSSAVGPGGALRRSMRAL